MTVSEPLEKQVVESITRAMKKRGCIVLKTHGSPAGAGWPDLIGVLPGGMAFAIEVKRPSRRHTITRLQQRELDRWASCGARSGLATSAEEALAICGLDS